LTDGRLLRPLDAFELEKQISVVRLVTGRIFAGAHAIRLKGATARPGPLCPAPAALRARHDRPELLHGGKAQALVPKVADDGSRVFRCDRKVADQLRHDGRRLRAERLL